MRAVAFDYGSARCGCAISDTTGTVARPLEPVLNPDSKAGTQKLVEIIEQTGAEVVVVGLPIGLSGADTEQTKLSAAFADRIADLVEVPVQTYDERFTSKLADRTLAVLNKKDTDRTRRDSIAAAHLLEDYLHSEARKSES